MGEILLILATKMAEIVAANMATAAPIASQREYPIDDKPSKSFLLYTIYEIDLS
jgi:hypothetical protein